jgi:hypothetical protein
MSDNSKQILFFCVFALVFYVTGAAFVQSFVNYPTWKLIGAGEFQNYHNTMSPLIIKFMVLPWLSEIVLTVLLFWLRPRVVPVWMVASALVFNLLILASTAAIQVPIQIELGQNGLSQQAIEKLLKTDPIRWVSGSLVAFLYLWMMSRVVLAPEEGRDYNR